MKLPILIWCLGLHSCAALNSFDTVTAKVCYDGLCGEVTGKVHHSGK